jgi:hypothetical protein
MATYTADQLKGAGTPVEAIAANTGKTFLFGNPSGSGYFTIETVKVNSGSFAGQATNAIGAYASFTGIDADTLVTSSYISSVVVPSGASSYQFTPTSNVAVSSSMLRATGDVTLTIS